MKLNKYRFVLFLEIIFFASCNYTPDNKLYKEDENADTNKVLISVKNVIESTPSPSKIAKIINESKVKFNPQLLNPVSNVPFYESSKSLALNLGIYCADLSYASFYGQNQLVNSNLSAIKTISENLGILQLIENNDLIEVEDNVSNPDSLRLLIDYIFLNSQKYLNESNRPEMVILVQTGAWIEGMYIAMQLATQSIEINKELVDKIVQQRKSLDQVVKALNYYAEYSIIQDVYKDMIELQNIYHQTILKPNNSINKKSLTVKTRANVTPEIFMNMYKTISRIRNSFTQ